MYVYNLQTGFQTSWRKRSQTGNFEYALIPARPSIGPSKDPGTQFRRFKKASTSNQCKSVHYYWPLRGLSYHLPRRRIILTHHVHGPSGHFCYTRMPFGIASGPEEYQRRQHEFLDGLQGVINIADDIWVFGRGNSKEEADMDHDKDLTSLLEKSSKHDLRLSTRNFQFESSSFTFMGHTGSQAKECNRTQPK